MHKHWKIIRFSSGLFFAVTCFVGFIALMILNLYVFESLFPGIVNAVKHLGGGKGTNLFMVIISCPIPLTVCFGWYKFFKWIDKIIGEKILSDSLEKYIYEKETIHKDNNNEIKLNGYLAACAGLFGLILIIGFGLGLKFFGLFEKTGYPVSDQGYISFIFGFPIAIIAGYAIARSLLVKKFSKEIDHLADKPDC